MLRYCRVTAKPTEDSKGVVIQFDALIAEDDRLVDETPLFGSQGALETTRDQCMPFVVRPGENSRIVDFGQEYGDPEKRFAKSSLPSVPMRNGQIFTWSGKAYSETYRIVSVTVRLEGQHVISAREHA